MDQPRRIFVPDLQETVAMTVEQYYHTRVKPKEAQPRLPGDRRYRTLDEAARARSGMGYNICFEK